MDNVLPAKRLPVVQVGRNCWRMEHANRVAVVVDAADYFHFVHELCESARNLLIFVGWDFDSRISLEPGERAERVRLSRFFFAAGETRPKTADCNPEMALRRAETVCDSGQPMDVDPLGILTRD